VYQVTEHALLLAAAVMFAFVNGANDGGSLLSFGLSVRTITPLVGLLMLAAAVMISPILLGTAVATTLAIHLVGLDGDGGRSALLVGVLTTIAVTLQLTRRGLPTSLTLGLVGAMAGAGTGSGVPVSWGLVGVVLLAGAAAPFLGLAMGRGLTLLSGKLPTSRTVQGRVKRWHAAAFLLLCVAYGVNDGQKMLAVFAVAASPMLGPIEIVPWQLVALTVPFLAGAVFGLGRFAETVGLGLLPMRPPEAVTTELSAGVVVLATGVAGMPVSMTQAASGALIGAAVSRGHGVIRWKAAARIVGAWAVTLPCSFIVAAAAAFLLSTL